MKKTIILLAVVFALIFNACKGSCCKTGSSTSTNASQTFNLDTTRLKSGEAFYQCAMDPQVISDKPGACPVCGMDLSEMKKH